MPQRPSFHRSCFLAASWFATWFPNSAHGAHSPCDQDAVCLQHLDQALELDQGQKYELALREFRAAHLRKPSPRLMLNIGRTLHKLGRFDEAVLWYRDSGRAAPADATLQQELRGFMADATLGAEKSKVRPIVLKPDIQVQSSPVHVTPLNNIHINLAQSLRNVVVAPEPQVMPLHKQPWLWATVGAVLAGGVAGLAIAVWPRPWQPGAAVPSYQIFSVMTGGAL